MGQPEWAALLFFHVVLQSVAERRGQGGQVTAGTQGSIPQRRHPAEFNALELAAKASPQRTGCAPQFRPEACPERLP